jgi:preprotein translocase subunit SecE
LGVRFPPLLPKGFKKMINPLRFIQSVKQEAFKVTWPNRKDVMIGSIMVFVLATIAAIFFLLLDQIYKFLLDIILTISL